MITINGLAKYDKTKEFIPMRIVSMVVNLKMIRG